MSINQVFAQMERVRVSFCQLHASYIIILVTICLLKHMFSFSKLLRLLENIDTENEYNKFNDNIWQITNHN